MDTFITRAPRSRTSSRGKHLERKNSFPFVMESISHPVLTQQKHRNSGKQSVSMHSSREDRMFLCAQNGCPRDTYNFSVSTPSLIHPRKPLF